MTPTPGGATVHGTVAPTTVAVGFASDLGRHGTRTALVADDRALSYADLAALVGARAATLGVRQRLIGLRPAPTVEFVVDYLAALAGGHAVLLAKDDALPRAYGARAATPPALHPDLRLLLSTSGSTGSPKLVRLSATNLESNATAIATYLGLTADDVAITTLPLDYCYGLSVLHSHLAVGAAVVLTDLSVSEPALWDLARTHRVTSFAGVPYTFDLLDAAGWPDLPTLRLVTQAGGRLAPDKVRTLAAQGRREGFELVVMYGQTEATARMAYLPPDLADTYPDAIGVPIPGGDLRIDLLEGAGPGIGELVYTGPNVMMGYAHSVADLALGPGLTELRTGDLARRNDAGLVEIVGRSSRFAKIFGQRIDLDRVEALLALDHHEAACAETPGGEGLVVAAAVPSPVDAVAAAVTAATGLPPHAVTVVPVVAVPRRANGKVDQRAVAALAPTPPARSSTPPAADPATPDPVAALTRLYRDVLGADRVTTDDSFVSLGGDSLSYVELSLQLEERLHRVPADWPARSIADLAGLASDRPSRLWARVETSIVLRAVAIVLIVGTHTNLFTVLGGAHALLAVAGANFARFHLSGDDPRDRLRRVLRSATRIAVPAVVWIGAVTLVTGTYPWRTVVLLNDVLGSPRWSEPAWHFWFIEVVLLLAVGAGLLTAVPRVAALERRHRFGLAAGLTAAALAPRFWADAASYDGDVIHSSVFVAWLYLGGWAATVARTTPQRLLISALLLAGTYDFTGDPRREAVIAVGLLCLVWVRTVPWPRALVGATGTLAGASLFIYLTHWQVYPAFEDRWPLVGLVLSLAVGVLAWRLVDLTAQRLRLLERPRSCPTPRPGAGRPAPGVAA